MTESATTAPTTKAHSDPDIGRVTATHIWPPEQPVPVAVARLELDWGGPIGDRHHGLTMTSDARQKPVFPRGTIIRNHRQVSIIDVAELAEIAARMGIAEIAPGTIAENIATSGLPRLTSLAPMTRLVFSSGAVIMTGGENLPCVIAGRLVTASGATRLADGQPSDPSAFVKAAMARRGITGWVEHPGVISPGDTVRVVAP